MREEYTEYKGRRDHRTRNTKKNTGYLKKLLRQTVFSSIIFTIVISPELLGVSFGKNIRAITKSALFYTIDTQFVTDVFKNFQPHKGEQNNAKETTARKDI